MLPPTAPARRRSVTPLLTALFAALLLLRRPESLLAPQFWAEDGALFFQEAFNLGFPATALRPVAGYLLTLPRLAAGFSLLLPMELAPLVFAAVAFAVQLAPACYLASPRMAAVAPSPAARVAAALIYLALPASFESHVNLTNSQWYLALTALCILVAQPPPSALLRALEAGAAALFSLSGPFSILFLPLVAPRLLRALRGERGSGTLAPAAAIAAGAVIQAGVVLTGSRVGAAIPWERLGPRDLATVVSLHTFFTSIFGIGELLRFYQSLPPVAHGAGLLAVALLLLAAVRGRVRPLLSLGYLAALSIALACAFPLNDPKSLLLPTGSPRYFLFSSLFVLLSLLRLACGPRPWRWAGAAGLGAALAFGIRADFVHPRLPDTRWADQVAVFRSLPAGSDFYVPVVPLFHGGMVLRKSAAQRREPPLARLRPLASATAAEVTVSRPPTLLLTRVPNDSFLRFDGCAVDGEAQRPAGRVFLRIGEKLFPAVSGLPGEGSLRGRVYADCGFSRLVPVAEIGPGTHQLSVIAVAADGKGYFQPSPPRAFSTSQFFP